MVHPSVVPKGSEFRYGIGDFFRLGTICFNGVDFVPNGQGEPSINLRHIDPFS